MRVLCPFRHSQARRKNLECGGKRYSARRRFLIKSAAAGWCAKAMPRGTLRPHTSLSKTLRRWRNRLSVETKCNRLSVWGLRVLSAHSAERKRCRDPRTARLLSPHSKFFRRAMRGTTIMSIMLIMSKKRNRKSSTCKHQPFARHVVAGEDARAPTLCSPFHQKRMIFAHPCH